MCLKTCWSQLMRPAIWPPVAPDALAPSHCTPVGGAAPAATCPHAATAAWSVARFVVELFAVLCAPLGGALRTYVPQIPQVVAGMAEENPERPPTHPLLMAAPPIWARFSFHGVAFAV